MTDSAAPLLGPSSIEPVNAPVIDIQMARWIHPTVILVATDLTDLDRLMPFALEQAVETGARLILLHVVSVSASMAADAAGMPYYDPAGALDFASKGLQPWCASARQNGIRCESLVREGNAEQQICAAARQFKADRLMLGTRSRSRLGKLLLGSVAEQVLRTVNLPVVTVGPQAHLDAGARGSGRVVLHATQLREAARAGAMLAGNIAASQHAKVVLLHVLRPAGGFLTDQPGRDGQPAGHDSAELQQARRLAVECQDACGAEVEVLAVHGNPAIEILAAASERRASLIVLGARNRSMFEELTRDRTVCQVLAHARCPVLTLREGQQGAVGSEARQEAACC
jgi:nucleotide-binding universal stress UspA family protein